MTLLTAWTTYDSRAPSSAYIATDSRISFRPGSGRWDHARKCFASAAFPDIFGYVGEVLLPSHVLNQYVATIDLVGESDQTQTFELRSERLVETVKEAIANFPNKHVGFEILHISRKGQGLESVFHSKVVTNLDGTITERSMSSPDHAAVLEYGTEYVQEAEPIVMAGSGKPLVRAYLREWNATEHTYTSRTAFSAHCDAITSGKIDSVGGYPQLVGLYRQGTGQTFGVVTGDASSALAFGTLASMARNSIPFRNELFERVDSAGTLLDGATPYQRPSSAPN